MLMEQTSSADFSEHASHRLIPSDRVEGTPVRRLNGERIGIIKRLMIDKTTGQIAYAVLNFGGFMGLGQKHYPIAWNRLKYDPMAGAYQLDLSEQEMRAASGDGEFDWGDRVDPIIVHNYQAKPTYWGMF